MSAVGQSPGTDRVHSVPGRDAQVTLSCTGKEQVGRAHSHLGTCWVHTFISRNFDLEAEPSVAAHLGSFGPFVLLNNHGRKETVQSSQHAIRKNLKQILRT